MDRQCGRNEYRQCSRNEGEVGMRTGSVGTDHNSNLPYCGVMLSLFGLGLRIEYCLVPDN